jgi:hypothetical protein
MVEGIIDKEPENMEVPFYNSDKNPVMKSFEKFTIPKRDRFEKLPGHKNYVLTVPHCYNPSNSPGYEHSLSNSSSV